MNPDFVPVPNDSTRSAQLLLYTAATPLQIIQGTATGAFDLSPYVKVMKQQPSQLDFTLAWHTELNGKVPVPGNLVVVNLGTKLLWTGIVQEVANYQNDRGTRELQLTARTRDGNALWQTTPRVSDIYPAGTQLTYIAQQLCSAIGLSAQEMALPAVSAYTVQDNVQMANVSIWDMLTTLYEPVGYEPYIDGYGRIKCISRDTQRTPDIVLTNDRTLAIKGSYSKRQKTSARVKWLDPNLSLNIGVAQSLMNVSLTAGFFMPEVHRDVYFSTDGTQQAVSTFLMIKQSCNTGLLPVATEHYEQITPTMGRITLTNTYFTPGFIVVALFGVWAASYIPDITDPFGGPDIPVGKIVQGGLLLSAMLVMSSIGTGSYEVWGQPSSWVHQTNTTEAYDVTAPAWQEDIVEIDNDFVMNEAMSEAFATRELMYEVQSAVSYGAQIVDDPRIEVGDILQAPDGSQIYVTGYTRDLSRGASTMLDVTGFQCGATGSAIANVDQAIVNLTATVATGQGQFAGVMPPVTGSVTTSQGQSVGQSTAAVVSGGRAAALLAVIRNAIGVFSGQHMNYWDSNQFDQFSGVMPNLTIDGIVPAALGVNFGQVGDGQDNTTHQSSATASRWIAAGGIVQASWWCTNPFTGVNDNVRTGYNFSDIYTPSTPLNTIWNGYLDDQIARCKAVDGPFLYRPFVELNGNWSWWGGQPTAEFIALWRYTYAYFASHGVTNALWVYNVNEDLGNYTAYYPGVEFVDVVSWDSYPVDANDVTWYNALATLGKPIIISECGAQGLVNFSIDYGAELATVRSLFPLVKAMFVWCQGAAIKLQNGGPAFMSGALGRSSVPAY